MSSSCITKISGTAIPLRGDDIDTDRIVPARYLRCVTFNGLGEHVLEDDRAQDPDHSFNQNRFQGASILIVGKNFGCGSSREHAPQALHKWGISGIIGQSFAEIFFANCQAMGVPCFVVGDNAGESLLAKADSAPETSFVMDIVAACISYDDKVIQASIPAGVQRSFLEGAWDATSVLLQAGDDINRLKKTLPYLNDFQAVV